MVIALACGQGSESALPAPEISGTAQYGHDYAGFKRIQAKLIKCRTMIYV
ncbi:MAG: hypothetical protein PHW04_05690 [Candidatus Wallbacteria bacterium]|nr:hypothetical protein [Candidatus Wallbacteria bacterium]